MVRYLRFHCAEAMPAYLGNCELPVTHTGMPGEFQSDTVIGKIRMGGGGASTQLLEL